jgi:hypothetical protein
MGIYTVSPTPIVFMQRIFPYLMVNQELLQVWKMAKGSVHSAQLTCSYASNTPCNNLILNRELK